MFLFYLIRDAFSLDWQLDFDLINTGVNTDAAVVVCVSTKCAVKSWKLQSGENSMKSVIQAVKGTRDFYPEDMAIRNWLYGKIREVSQLFGYQEYEGPILERIDLYAAKSGEELVKEQAFVFPDRGGDLITLRPELTPTLARMVAQRQNTLVYPLRWWSFGPFWRYERPQKGRTREFFQWNIDLIGVDSPEADAELIAVCATFFEKVGLGPQQIGIFVNNRRLMDSQLERIGIGEQLRPQVFRLIDRRDKMSPVDWDAYAQEMGLDPKQLQGLKELLSDPDLWRLSSELVRVFDTLEGMGLGEYICFEPQIVRGLDYYTGTVFEARDRARDGRAILGGGRYDNLVGDVGGNPLPGVGFAMGDVMIGLVLEKYGLLPELVKTPARVLVTVFDEARLKSSFALATELRKTGIPVLVYPEAVKLPRQLKFADRVGVRYVLIVGPDEEAAGLVTVKDLNTGAQENISRSEIVRWLAQRAV